MESHSTCWIAVELFTLYESLMQLAIGLPQQVGFQHLVGYPNLVHHT